MWPRCSGGIAATNGSMVTGYLLSRSSPPLGLLYLEFIQRISCVKAHRWGIKSGNFSWTFLTCNQKQYLLTQCCLRFCAQKENNRRSIHRFLPLMGTKGVTISNNMVGIQRVLSPHPGSLRNRMTARILHYFLSSQLLNLVKLLFKLPSMRLQLMLLFL